MSFDLYAELVEQSKCPATAGLPAGLSSGFVDGCTAWFALAEIERATHDELAGREHDKDKKKELRNRVKASEKKKNNARNCYMKHAQVGELTFPKELADLLDPVPPVLQPVWLAIEVTFTLETPWYSKDDRPFHVLDNPVRKDRVFRVPFMSAASWKGLLRWSFAMTAGLIGPDPLKGEEKRRQAEAAILHLFGNEKGASDDFQRGALAFYPTWFPRVGFEVINPHSRKTRAGTQPIYYEVVPARYQQNGAQIGTKATLRLLYAPLPGQAPKEGVEPQAALNKLLDATDKLLTVYGFSAKRTAGWGLAKVDDWVVRNGKASQEGDLATVKARLPELLGTTEARP
jgi:CRISPR-associated protein Cmr2